MFVFKVAAFLTGAGLISAQSISSGCQSTLTQLVASPDAACLNPQALVSLVLNPNASVVNPINNWLQGLCATGPCSNASLSAVVTNITSGCNSDLSSLGLSTSSNSVGSLISTVQQLYPTVRQIACLKDTSQNGLCVTETLNNLQTIVGTITFSNAESVITKIASGSPSIPSNVTCTDCVKQAYNLVQQQQPSLASSLSQPAQSQCGSSFTDGTTPSDIQDTASASGSSNSNQNGAVSLFSASVMSGLAASGLIAISSMFIVLA